MRSVSLEKISIRQLQNSDSSYIDNAFHIHIVKNKLKYEQMLMEQSSEFWTKFVIVVRELYLDSSPNSNISDLDNVYIDFLSTIKTNNIEKLIHFMIVSCVQNEECMKTLDLSHTKNWTVKMSCVKSSQNIIILFIKLLNVWENSKSGDQFDWSMPYKWLSINYKPGKFDKYLLSVYSIEEIEENFKCEVKNIPWLQQLSSKCECSSEMNTEETTATTSTEDTKSYNEEPEEIKKLQPTYEVSLGWLPKPQNSRSSKNPLDKGLLEEIRTAYPRRLGLYNLIQLSIPPILSIKYHANNIQELLKNKRYADVVTWTMWWNRTFGLQYLNKVHTLYKHGETINMECEELQLNKQEKLEPYLKVLDYLKKFISESYEMDCAPKEEDYATKAPEFLQEPFVIIQLPWNTIMLHQWLVGALFEVLLFEKHSMELRHWPLPPEIANIATKLIFLVTRLKERVLAGFAILFKQIHTYPEINKNHPNWILDIIVLPSLNVLNFLTSGKAFTLLKSIKKIAWSKSQKMNNTWLYMAESVYEFDIDLRKMFIFFCYSYVNWEEFKEKSTDPFAEPVIKCIDFSKLMEKLQSNHDIEKASSTVPVKYLTDFSVRHRCSLETDIDIKNANNIDLIKIAAKTVEEVVIKPGRVQNVNWDAQVSEFILKPPIINTLELMFRKETSVAHLLIALALLYKKRYTSLLNTDKENSILSRIINLGLEVSEREYIITMTQCVSQLAEQNPIAIKMEHVTAMEISTMSKILTDLEVEKKDRDWLWNQFPKEWNQPINRPTMEITHGLGIENIFKIYEFRVGRFLMNISNVSFDLYEKNGEIFPYWHDVQYILPSFVAMLITYMQSNDTMYFINLVKFINSLFTFYEHSYISWKNGKKLEKTIPELLDHDDVLELDTVSIYYSNITFALGYAHTKLDIHTTLNKWKNLLESNEVIAFDIMKPLTITIYYHMKNYYDVCLTAWKPPIPGNNVTALPEFTEFYLTDAIVHILELTFSYICRTLNIGAQIVFSMPDLQLKPLLRNDTSHEHWRVQFFQYLTQDNDDINENKHEIMKVTSSERTSLITVYNGLKMFIKDKGPFNLKLIHLYPVNPIQLQMAVKYLNTLDFKHLDKLLPLLINPQRELFTSRIIVKDRVKGKLKVQTSVVKIESGRNEHQSTLTYSVRDLSATFKDLEFCTSKQEKESCKTSNMKEEAPSNVKEQVECKTSVKKENEEEKENPMSSNVTEKEELKPSEASSSKKGKKSKNKKGKNKNKNSTEIKRKCRKCDKVEDESLFIVCDECIKDEYPDIHFFCSILCKNDWWNLKHKSQHLDFILQIGEFAPKS